MDLSVIIPVWNEEKKIKRDLIDLNSFFSSSGKKAEVIVVDDGSSDGTIEIIQRAKTGLAVPLKIISQEHSGKGKATREGILTSSGNTVLFMDCGANVPFKFIRIATELIEKEGYDLAIASRKLSASTIYKKQVWFRRILSFLFRRFTHIYLNLPDVITDSQCGFKAFKGDIARELFRKSRLNGFLFDLEIILSALKKDYTLTEFAIEWSNDPDSRFNVLRSIWPIFKDLLYLKGL